ncbi:DUF3124 domain-containing protein [Ekhidna sp.]|uniref:DUF3124 domain-containing protein n=1 Tax=Ekhidna sp. TaxID=2608089 RepID=UPI0032984344
MGTRGIIYFLLALFISSCAHREVQKPESFKVDINWRDRTVGTMSLDSLHTGQTYLSVYSDIYINTDQERILLGATISIKNPNRTDSIFLTSADYFETTGTLLRNYVKAPVFVLPMETVEIVIPRLDKEGGSGANFLFDWRKREQAFEPIFECLMLSAIGNRSFSFSTHGQHLVRNTSTSMIKY